MCNRYRKRKIFFVFILVMLSVLIISSNYVWKIELSLDEECEFENIMEDLNEAGLNIGMKKSDINSKQIINDIRTKRDDIAWIGIEQSGTNVIVKIVEATELPELVDEDDYCDIVADKEGIISSINVRDGTAKVVVGDVVKVGDILIEGIMEGKYTEARMVHSKGDIEARVWYTKNVKIEYNTTELKETGEKEKKYAIKFESFSINLYKTISKFEIYDTIETEQQIKLFSNFYLPISVVEKEIIEQEKEVKQYTEQQAVAVGIKEAESLLIECIDEESEIVNKNVNMYPDDDGINIYVTYEVLENIGTKEKF